MRALMAHLSPAGQKVMNRLQALREASKQLKVVHSAGDEIADAMDDDSKPSTKDGTAGPTDPEEEGENVITDPIMERMTQYRAELHW